MVDEPAPNNATSSEVTVEQVEAVKKRNLKTTIIILVTVIAVTVGLVAVVNSAIQKAKDAVACSPIFMLDTGGNVLNDKKCN